MNGPRILLGLTAGSLLLGAGLIGGQVGDYGQWVHLNQIFGVVGGSLVLATAWVWRSRPLPRRWLLVMALFGISLRLAVLPATRELSDDAARYHWDGKAIAHGVNPFLFAPDAPEVARLWTQPIDERINHPWNRTCYPPVAEGLFTIAYFLSPGRLLGLQLLSLLAEIITWVILARELSRRQRPRSWLLLVMWSPLLISQGYLPGHVDMLLLPFVALLLGAVTRKQAGRSGLWLVLACLIKPLPLLFLPAIMRELGWRRTAQLGAVFLGVALVAYWPFRAAGWFLFSSTWLMATDWTFNGSVGHCLELLLPMRQAHLAAGILTGLGIVLVTWRGRDFLSRAVAAFIVFVIFTPTLFPWYLVSVLPLLVLRPQPALLALGVMVPLADQVMIGFRAHAIWSEAPWVRWAQYVAFCGSLAAGVISTRTPTPPPPTPAAGTPRSHNPRTRHGEY